MRIAMAASVLPSDNKNGAGYQAHYLANALVRRGHFARLWSMSPKPESALYEHTVVPRSPRLTIWAYAYHLRTQSFDTFDALHCHGDDCLLFGAPRPRHIHTYHGSCLAEAINAGNAGFAARMAVVALGELVSLAVADETVAVSDNTRRYIPFVKRVIPCGVDTRAFSPGDRRSGAPSILFVGTMHGRKRGRMLLDLFRTRICKQIPAAELWCVCDRPEGESDAAGVRWFGRVSQEVLTRLYREAWVFCLPSTYEGFGVPYVEAMASGTPVIASPNVGAVEVTRGGRDGIIARDEELAQSLIDALRDDGLRSRLREAGLKRSVDFSWDRVCEQYEAVYAGNSVRPAAQAAV